MPWQEFEQDTLHLTKQYGFVINHPTYWGIPIPGYDTEPQPHEVEPTSPGEVPKELVLGPVKVTTDCWTGGDIKILATRTPPLFHAFHHKTNQDLPAHEAFERRARNRIVGLLGGFKPFNPLPGQGERACVELFKVNFSEYGTSVTFKGNPKFPDFNTETLINQAETENYFKTDYNPAKKNGQEEWRVDRVGPLNALWFVILEDRELNVGEYLNDPLARLGEGYRLWHQKTIHHGGHPVTDGYSWKSWKDDGYKKIRVEIELSGQLNRNLKRAPEESLVVTFEYEWI